MSEGIIDDGFLSAHILTKALCPVAAAIHRTGFDFPWDTAAFESLLLLPTTVGWVNETGLLVCSKVCDEMEILTICVVSECRRQGVGLRYLSFLTEYARQNGVRRIFLEVSQQNEAARRLYIKSGFRNIGVRKNYYRTKNGFCDAVCMEKVIENS